MKKILAGLAAGLTLVGMTSITQATPISITSGPGLDISIPDDGYDGSLASMASDTINVGDGGLVTDLTVTISMSHTWVGDLIIKLLAPDGTLVTLLSRPGFDEAADNGEGGVGDGSDLVFDSPIVFNDSYITSSELMGDGLAGDGDAGGMYLPYSGAATGGTLSSFFNKPMTGDWTLYIGDRAPQDYGTINSWTLDFEYSSPVPEPGTMFLFGTGLAGIAGFRIRRKKKQQQL